MPRTLRPVAAKGSEKWIQLLVNNQPALLSSWLCLTIAFSGQGSIQWLSPKENDKYAEYRDEAFLDHLGLGPLQSPLKDFWPAGGPRWDALGKTDGGELLLVEGKAHLREMASPKSKANSSTSKAKIHSALEKTKQVFAPDSRVDWSANYYQYANRLAHLYWLRKINQQPAYMIFLYFCGDDEMNGPKDREAWETAIKKMETLMGIRENELSPFVVELFVDVQHLQLIPPSRSAS